MDQASSVDFKIKIQVDHALLVVRLCVVCTPSPINITLSYFYTCDLLCMVV